VRHALITGAAGFIGRHAVREFVEQGWRVFALVHKASSSLLDQLASHGRVTLIRGDVTRAANLAERLKRAMKDGAASLDVLVHCAARTSDVGWRREFRRTNFESVRDLVAMAQDLSVGRFVFVSTTDVYGLKDFNGEDEDELPLAANPRNPHPEFKIASERWIRRHLPPERYAIVRPAAVWGAGDTTLTPRIAKFLRRSPWIVHFGKWRGANRWPLAHVRNVAAAIFLAAVSSEAAGCAINVLDDERTSIEDFYRIVAERFLPGKTFREVCLPLWVGEAAGAIVSTVSNCLNLDRPLIDPSLYAVRSVSSNLDFSNRKFLQLLAKAGRPIVTREEGMRELDEDDARRSAMGRPSQSDRPASRGAAACLRE
jgi:nucleoside-diphosphate-sugar epimerase